jgi:3-hydroxybutyryl-CoA dehydrogenase
MHIKKIGVLGAGVMGSGIAQICAVAEFHVTMVDVSSGLVEKGLMAIDKSLSKSLEKKKITISGKQNAIDKIHGTTSIVDLADCDIVFEAIVENLVNKLEAIKELDQVCKADAILASNTSSLSITQMAASSKRAERFVGTHFFNPVPIMKLVEVVDTMLSKKEIFDEVFGLMKRLGKEPVHVHDTTGFIVNRLFSTYLLDAIRALEEGVGSVQDIDKAMKLGVGHPMGPFELLDLTGLDTNLAIANIFYEEFREKRFSPPTTLKRMVAAGRLGRKTGRGFYDYKAS